MAIRLNFINPYTESGNKGREVKTKLCQGCFLVLPITVFGVSVFNGDSDYCESCIG